MSREDEEDIQTTGPIQVQVPQAENAPTDPPSPNRNSPRHEETPVRTSPTRDTPGSERTDPSYVPEDTPRTRRELGTTRVEPPLTRYRARLQPLREQEEQE
jgi:hypothetical protein